MRQWRFPNSLLIPMLKDLPSSVRYSKSPIPRAQHGGAYWLRSRLDPSRRGASVVSSELSADSDVERAAEQRPLFEVTDLARSTRRSVLAT